MNRFTVFDSYRAHVNPGKIELFERLGFDAVMGRREGVRFWDEYDDRSWIDCHGNGGVYNLGHRHPVVVDAVTASLRTTDIGNHHLASAARARLAERLAATTGDRLPGVIFGVGGGEAADLAIKLAMGHTGRPEIVSVRGGYHGHTGLAAASGDPAYREPFHLELPGFRQVPFNDLPAVDAVVGEHTAAVIVEPIPATLGMVIPDDDYLPGVAAACRDRGALLIVDEVQTGLGRTGRMWAHLKWDLRPDMMIVGKGLSGGIFPISATLVSAPILEMFRSHPFSHISTFGGAEPGCAAALAVLDVVETPGFLDRVSDLGRRFEDGLSDLPFMLRRQGMFMACAFDVPDAGVMAAKALFDLGVFAVWANNDTSVLQFLPPLVTNDAEAEEIISVVRRVFQ